MESKCKITGKDSIQTFLSICENEFNNPSKSYNDHQKMLNLLGNFKEPEIVEAKDRMGYELELEMNESGVFDSTMAKLNIQLR